MHRLLYTIQKSGETFFKYFAATIASRFLTEKAFKIPFVFERIIDISRWF